MKHKSNTTGLRPVHSKWKSCKDTKPVRIPVTLIDDVLAYARALDCGDLQPPSQHRELDKVIQILNDALSLKANSGGKIKEKIKEALEVIERL